MAKLEKDKTAKILLIDDSATIRAITKDILKKADHELDLAENGEEGLLMCKKTDYDLVLLDIKMPGIDGFEVFRRLRGQEETRLLPEIIFYSDFEKMEMEGLQLGACDFINKSHVTEHSKEFVARVEAHLKISQLTRKCIELERMRILRATIMSVDHEVRNPLVSIGMIFHKMQNCPQCGKWFEKGKECALRISEALDRLSSTEAITTTKFHGREELDTSPEPKNGIKFR